MDELHMFLLGALALLMIWSVKQLRTRQQLREENEKMLLDLRDLQVRKQSVDESHRAALRRQDELKNDLHRVRSEAYKILECLTGQVTDDGDWGNQVCVILTTQKAAIAKKDEELHGIYQRLIGRRHDADCDSPTEMAIMMMLRQQTHLEERITSIEAQLKAQNWEKEKCGISLPVVIRNGEDS